MRHEVSTKGGVEGTGIVHERGHNVFVVVASCEHPGYCGRSVLYFEEPQAFHACTPDPAADAVLRLRVGAVVAVVCFAFYVFRLSSAPGLLDSAELAAASFGLGVAHPPGEPLALLWGRWFCVAPLGTAAFRVALGQAVCGVAAVLAVYALVLSSCWVLPRWARGSASLRTVVASGAALVFGFSSGAADVASRPEVYALATALALWGLWLAQAAQRHSDARYAVASAFVLGLGVTNHPLIAGTAGLGALVACVPLLVRAESWRDRFALVAAAVVAVLLGMMVLIYVPARAYALLGHPDAHTLVWGNARSFAGWWWVLSARTFAEKNAFVQTGSDPASLPFLVLEEVGVFTVCLALVGFYVLLRFVAPARLFALSLSACAMGALLSGLVGGLDPNNPDIRGYLACVFAVFSVFAGVGVCALCARLPWQRGRPVLATLLVLGLLGTPLYALATQVGLRQGARERRSADAVVRHTLHSLAPRSVLITGHFETAFLLSYARLVEGQRPDVSWVNMGWVNSPGYAERMRVAQPQVAPLFKASGRLPASVAAELTLPWAVEGSVNVAPEVASKLSYGGGLWQTTAQATAGESTALLPWMYEEAQQDRQTRGFLAWRVFQDARLACKAQPWWAPHLIERVQRLLPNDGTAKALPAWCKSQGRYSAK